MMTTEFLFHVPSLRSACLFVMPEWWEWMNISSPSATSPLYSLICFQTKVSYLKENTEEHFWIIFPECERYMSKIRICQEFILETKVHHWEYWWSKTDVSEQNTMIKKNLLLLCSLSSLLFQHFTFMGEKMKYKEKTWQMIKLWFLNFSQIKFAYLG